MAREIRALVSLNPTAMRIRSLILVLVDSIRALDRSCSSMFSIEGRCLRILRARSTKGFSFWYYGYERR